MEQRSEMEQSNAAKDKFLSIIAHDLRNPFNSIIGFSELMLNNLRHYSIRKMEKQLTYIYSTAGQTYNLLEDLLLWANSQSGKLTMAPAETDMKHVCSEVIEQFKDQTERKDISMLFSQSENILVWVDPDMFKTILRNLLSNAIKFSHNQGQIHVVVEKTKDFVMVTVSDTGVGINAADQKKLWQVDGSITNRGTDNEKGSGLGLLLCKEFVEKHGGHIWVDSEPCKGSDFKFTIPLYK
jgi:signal transduction histidine kinase